VFSGNSSFATALCSIAHAADSIKERFLRLLSFLFFFLSPNKNSSPELLRQKLRLLLKTSFLGR
jgi:hypothetical protein